LVYQAEKQLKDLADKVPEADKTKIESLIKDLKEALAADNHDQIKTLAEDLKQALYALSTAVYSQSGGDAGGAYPTDDVDGEPSDRTKDAASGDDDVIDADFTESK
jgi:molecular chaperone DnaK